MTSAWEGRLVRLRAVEPGDWEAFMAFDRYSDDVRAGWKLHPPRSAEQRRRQAGDDTAQQDLDEITTHHADRPNGTFEYGVAVGRPHQRRGYAGDAIVLVLRYMFAERRFTKCNAEVFASSTGSAALHERLGFVREGCRRRNRYAAGRYEDVILFGMTIDEFAARYGLTLR